MVGDDYKSITLRKMNDLSKSLLFYEHHKPITWVLKIHDSSLKKSQYGFTIGGIDQCKNYSDIISGVLIKQNQMNGSQTWEIKKA